MKINLYPLLFLSLLAFFSCKNKENDADFFASALIPHLNGSWYFAGTTNGSPNPTQPAIPLISDEVIWEINGKKLNIILKKEDTFAKLEEGKYEIAIERVTNLDDLQFLIVNGKGFGAITVIENQLTLNTSQKPNESISHAPTYTFVKKE